MNDLFEINRELLAILKPIFGLPNGCRKVTISFGLDQLPSVELERIVQEPGLPTRTMIQRFTLSQPETLASVRMSAGDEITDIESTARTYLPSTIEPDNPWPRA